MRHRPHRNVADYLASASRRFPDIRGKGTLGWWYMRHLDRTGRLRGEWQLQLADGARYVLPRQARMAWALSFRGSYDAASRELLARYIRPGTLVLDIGASIGLWTVDLALRAEEAGAQVWAIEPHPRNVEWLRRNLDLNHVGPVVTVHNVAVGEALGSVKLMDLGEAGSEGGGGNAAVVTSDQQEGISVPVVTLDSLPRSTPVSAIKIDVEGYEVRALRGATELIRRDRPVIFGEFNAGWLSNRGDDLAALLDEMRDIGYEVFAVEQIRSRPWLAEDATRLRPVARGSAAEDLLLVPAPCG